MTQWRRGAVSRIHRLAKARKVSFTLKAERELSALDLGLDEQDACDILAALALSDCAGRQRSAMTDEWMYLFKPVFYGVALYVKVIVRDDCVVVSFHEDEGALLEHET